VLSRVRSGTVRIEAEARRGVPARVEYQLTVPRGFGVGLEGVNMPVTVHDVAGAVRVSNVQGAVHVRGTTGVLAIESVGGTITVENTRGTVEVSTVNQGIRLSDVRGRVNADAVNGSITMRGIDASHVEASTVNGEISYVGSYQDGGHYYFGAHNGRVTVAVPERVNATLNVSSRTGRVDAGFPVNVGSVRDGRFSATFGTGSATIEVESFNGTVRLVRPGN
jgi:DUF4097 and DUF4098 domain-containing protein YvlB